MDRNSFELNSEQNTEFQRQWEILSFGTAEIVPEDEFKYMLKKSIYENVPLRVKCGIDPTILDVHLGHLVPYKKMRQFQDLGHIGVVIVGDYTASIGDPTGKNESRPPLSREEVKSNADKYMEQLFTVLDRDKTEVCFQTEWFDDVGLNDVLKWASQTTVAKLLSHETFRNRLDEGNSLALHELFYPVLQGVDSVYVRADVELGGTDQKFNVLMGRDYQKQNQLRPQTAILLPLITGTCGTQKMSKSLGNYISILDEPFDKFGKVMSIPDELMPDYFLYIAGSSTEEIKDIKQGLDNGQLHPNELKKNLAKKIVSFFHGDDLGQEMLQKFENVFKKGGVPEDATQVTFKRGSCLLDIMLDAGLIKSKGEGRRLFKQNAIGIVDAEKIQDAEIILDESFSGKVIKIGKRKFLKLF